jgi:hypothetical protein
MALDRYGRHHFLCRLGLPNLLQALEHPNEGFRQQRSTGRSASTKIHWRGEGCRWRCLPVGAQFVENNLVCLTSRTILFCSCRYMQTFIIRPVLSMLPIVHPLCRQLGTFPRRYVDFDRLVVIAYTSVFPRISVPAYSPTTLYHRIHPHLYTSVFPRISTPAYSPASLHQRIPPHLCTSVSPTHLCTSLCTSVYTRVSARRDVRIDVSTEITGKFRINEMCMCCYATDFLW